MIPVLSIMIPTFNRAHYLRFCLESVLQQSINKSVEVMVIDNGSIDATPQVVKDFSARYPLLRSFRNDRNLGYAGNQAKCIEYAAGQYIAILCDDDLYLSGAIDRILDVVRVREYSFIALNYCAFFSTLARPMISHVGPLEDHVFDRAYDIFRHPSVGHFSGFVFNANLAKKALSEILGESDLASFEVLRGILGQICVKSLIPAGLPSYYVGRILVGARQPLVVDYDSLQHLCVDFYRWLLRCQAEGLLPQVDVDFFRKFIIAQLPKALYRNYCYLDDEQRRRIRAQLDCWFMNEPEYICRVVPVIRRMELSWMRWGLRSICDVYRLVKPLWWKIRY